MSSIRNLKKNINEVFADLIESAYLIKVTNQKADDGKVESLVDEAIDRFDELIVKINQKEVENRKAHFKKIKADFEKFTEELVEKINSLN